MVLANGAGQRYRAACTPRCGHPLQFPYASLLHLIVIGRGGAAAQPGSFRTCPGFTHRRHDFQLPIDAVPGRSDSMSLRLRIDTDHVGSSGSVRRHSAEHATHLSAAEPIYLLPRHAAMHVRSDCASWYERIQTDSGTSQVRSESPSKWHILRAQMARIPVYEEQML